MVTKRIDRVRRVNEKRPREPLAVVIEPSGRDRSDVLRAWIRGALLDSRKPPAQG